jgi:hypothetical protein
LAYWSASLKFLFGKRFVAGQPLGGLGMAGPTWRWIDK